MARSTFAGGANDYTFTPFSFAGHKLVDLVGGNLTVWSAETAGTQYTNLLLSAVAVTSIPVGSDGQVPAFQGPDGVTVVWVDGGAGRIRMVDVETLAAVAVAAAADIDAAVTTAVANLVGGAPGALDTLNELAAALGDDASFATTVTNALAAAATATGDETTRATTAETALRTGTDSTFEARLNAAYAPLAEPKATQRAVAMSIALGGI